MRQSILIIVIVGLLGACAVGQIGNEFDVEEAAKIEKGVTTKEEVREIVGEPNSISVTDNNEMWMYNYSEGKNLVELFTGGLSGSTD